MERFNMFQKGIKILETVVGIISNNEEIICDPEYFEGKGQYLHSLSTNFHKLEEVDFSLSQAFFYVLDLNREEPKIFFNPQRDEIFAIGNFRKLEKETPDKRPTLFGNMGLFNRFFLLCLEKFSGIYSLHATSAYNPDSDELFIIVGSSGSGKSAVLLSAINHNLKLFSSEMTHFKVEKRKISFFKGALYHNIRVGSLVKDFPSLIGNLNIKIPKVRDIWNNYFSVCMSSVQEKKDILVNPKVRIIFPRIEFNLKNPIISSIDKNTLFQLLFYSVSEKITKVSLLYNLVPVGSIDKKELARERLRVIRHFVEKLEILSSKKIIANSNNCLDNYLS